MAAGDVASIAESSVAGLLEFHAQDGLAAEQIRADHQLVGVARVVLPGVLGLAASLGSWVVAGDQRLPGPASTRGRILWQYETGG